MTAEAEIVAVDTSVAVPYLVRSHPSHERVRAYLRGIPLVLAAHSLAETYSVLTRLPGDARLTPADAVTAIDANFGAIELAARAQARAHRLLAERGIAGGAVYDGLVALAAAEASASLASRDRRALATYAAMGIRVLLITG